MNPPVTMKELLDTPHCSPASLGVKHLTLNNEKLGEHLLATIYVFLEENDLLHVHDLANRPCAPPVIPDHPSWRGPFDAESGLLGGEDG
jgi:hypothetical protein